ncbi:MAG: hypothetical protein JNK72_16285 [Myxococcales bacterium]|nr:hypothetical protein [Myxococcales bacterium]
MQRGEQTKIGQGQGSRLGGYVGIALGLALGVVGASSACSSRRPQPTVAPLPRPSLCNLEVPQSRAGAMPTLRADNWGRLMLRGYNPGIAPGNAVDCTGRSISWREPSVRCWETDIEEQNAAGVPIPQRPITEDDVKVSRLEGNLRLVWVIVDRFRNGEAVGPVALTEFEGNRVHVRAMGTLRTFPQRVRLRLQNVGTRRVLIGEGEVCENDADLTTCRRQARFMLLRGDRFVAEPLRTAGGRCLGPARFEFAKRRTVRLGDTGLDRTFDLQTQLQYLGAGVQVHEQVIVSDLDPRRPDVPARVFRRAGQDRAIYVQNDAFVASDNSLWFRVLHVNARTNVADAGTAYDASAVDVPDADVEEESIYADFIDGGVE